MTGGNGVETEDVGSFEQTIELDVAIAFDARIGRHAVRVIGDVRIDDRPLEVVGEVEDEVVDAQLLSDSPRVVDVAHAAASRVALPSPEPQGDADDVVSGFFQQRGGDRRVDTTRHRDEDLHARTPDRVVAVRKWRTAPTTTPIACSTSASVVVCPSDKRRAP